MAANKKTDVTDTTYAAGARELETILEEIESGDADIDALSDKVVRAAELIKLCREKLTQTELRVNKVVEELAPEQDEAE